MRYRLKKLKRSITGVVVIETTIGFIALMLFVAILINLSYYIYCLNAVEAAIHKGLTKASWVQGLENPQSSAGGGENPKFKEAKEKLLVNIRDSISRSTGKSVRLADGDRVLDLTSASQGLRNTTEGIVVGLPKEDTTGTRDAPFTSQPIGITVNFKVKLLLPIPGFSEFNGHVEAWGYREPPSGLPIPPVTDCNGNPFDAYNPPMNCPLCPNGPINPGTGQCGCPDGKVPGVDSTGKGICVCDPAKLAALNCPSDHLYDENNCGCGPSCYDVTGQYQLQRVGNNTCGCAQVANTDGQCLPDRMVPDPSRPGQMKLEPTNCSNKNCSFLKGATWVAQACRCYCAGAMTHAEVTPWTGYDPIDPNAYCGDCQPGATRENDTNPTDDINPYCECSVKPELSPGVPNPNYRGCNYSQNEVDVYRGCGCGCYNNFGIQRKYDEPGPLDCGSCPAGQAKAHNAQNFWICCPACADPNAYPIMGWTGWGAGCYCSCNNGYISSGNSWVDNGLAGANKVLFNTNTITCVSACGNEPCQIPTPTPG